MSAMNPIRICWPRSFLASNHVRVRVNGTGRRVGRVRVRVSNQVVAITCSGPRKVRPKHISAVKFVTVVTYDLGVFPNVCVTRYEAELVDANEPARFSSRQKKIADGQKIWFSHNELILCARQHILNRYPTSSSTITTNGKSREHPS